MTLNRFARLLSELFWPANPCLNQWLADGDVNLCKCEEVTVGDFVDRVRRNPDITSASAAKLLTLAGMGLCERRYCQFAVTGLAARHCGESGERVGAFSARFPSKPVEISALVDSGLLSAVPALRLPAGTA